MSDAEDLSFAAVLHIDGIVFTVAKGTDKQDISIQLDDDEPHYLSPTNAMLVARAIMAAVKDHD